MIVDARDSERGGALILALMLLVLLGWVGLQVSQASGDLARRTQADPRGDLLRADNAIAKAKARLLEDPSAAWAMAPGGTLALLDEDGAQVALDCLALAPPGPVFMLDARAGGGQVRTWIRLRQVASHSAGPSLAALLVGGDVELTGNVQVDGRDHASDGQLTGDPGALGVVATGAIEVRGSADVGGFGEAPVHPGAPAALDPHTALWTEDDPSNGVDDDGDGLTDEAGPPGDAAQVLGRPAGSLEAQARAAGTYFTSLAAYDAWRRASTPHTAGGQVIYLELPAGARATPLTLPDNAVLDRYGTPRLPAPAPSIVVATRVGGGLPVGPLHAPEGFQGVAVLDRLRNANGTGSLVGMLAVLDGGPHTLGNGALRVLFSSEVLATLPDAPRTELEVLYWSRGR